MPNAAYAAMARYLTEVHRRKLLEPLADAYAALVMLAILIARAEADRDLDNARRLKVEAMQQRARAERAVHHIVEEIADFSAGGDLVDALMGDGGRTLAQVLLDDDG
jgi:hypothetical protein